jgi:hypothetical protein
MENDKEIRKMVKEMLDTEDKGFNNWELEFLDNMYKRTEYSQTMINKIQQIYDKKM